MALGQYKFVGIRKNGSVATLIEDGKTEKDARQKAKKTLKTITECRRLGDIISEDSVVQVSA